MGAGALEELALVVPAPGPRRPGPTITAPTGTSSWSMRRSASAIASRIPGSCSSVAKLSRRIDKRGLFSNFQCRSCCRDQRARQRPTAPPLHACYALALPLLSALLCATALGAATAPVAMAGERPGGARHVLGDRGFQRRRRPAERGHASVLGPARSSCATAAHTLRAPARCPRTRVVKVPRGPRSARTRAGSGSAPGAQRDRELRRPRLELDAARPGRRGHPTGWPNLQWNFMPETGVDAPDACST